VVGPQQHRIFCSKPRSVNDLRRGLRRGTIVCVSDWRMVRWQLHGLHGGSVVPILCKPSVCLQGNNNCLISLANFKRRAGFKHYWSISPFFAFAGSQ
jgi:hypothetical protein